MKSTRGERGFTLVELLIILGVIALLAAILAPSVQLAKALARRACCVANLNNLGRSMGTYHADNREAFWPGASPDCPEPGMVTYFWGTRTNPVDTRPSPFMKYCDFSLRHFWCPSFRWGTYKPQGGIEEPTTTIGYNAWCLDPASYMWDWDLRPKRSIQLPDPASLFVFADTAMAWSPAGRLLFQNSMQLEPVAGPPIAQPTTHFRHVGTANALCADGHAGYFGLEGAEMYDTVHDLGFVGTGNVPHYDIKN